VRQKTREGVALVSAYRAVQQILAEKTKAKI